MGLKIKDALIRGFFWRKVGETLKCYSTEFIKEMDRNLGIIARFFFSINTPINHNQIMFITFQGDYTCNPKYITEEILKENFDCDIVWSLRHASLLTNEQWDDKIRIIEVYSPQFYIELMRSKIIIVNSVEFLKQPTHLKKEQILIETWHGSLGIKKFGKENNSGKAWVRAAKICGKRANYIISNSKFENDVYRNTFWPHTQILEYGHPRNDAFFDPEQILSAKKKIRSKYKIDDSIRIFLYAPTFRDDKKFDCYKFNIDAVLNELEKKFGGEWIIAMRFHPTVRKSKDIKLFFRNKRAINMTNYPDIQDILLTADAAMTDYSSWIYDYILSRRPGFIFAQDIEKYYTERGFYYSLYDTPFSVAQNSEQLLENIRAFDEGTYCHKVNEFLNEKGCVEDGNASKRVVQKIKSIIVDKK